MIYYNYKKKKCSWFICLLTHTYTDTYKHKHIHIHKYKQIYTHKHKHMYTHNHIHIYTHMGAHTQIRISFLNLGCNKRYTKPLITRPLTNNEIHHRQWTGQAINGWLWWKSITKTPTFFRNEFKFKIKIDNDIKTIIFQDLLLILCQVLSIWQKLHQSSPCLRKEKNAFISLRSRKQSHITVVLYLAQPGHISFD